MRRDRRQAGGCASFYHHVYDVTSVLRPIYSSPDAWKSLVMLLQIGQQCAEFALGIFVALFNRELQRAF